MKRPLTTVAFFYVAGLLLGNYFQLPLIWLFAISFALLMSVLVSKQNLFLWPLIIILGWTNFASRTDTLSPRDLRLLLGDRAAYVTVHGTLAETPRYRVFEVGETESWRTLAQIKVTEIQENGEWQPAFGTIMSSTSGQVPETFYAGGKIEVTGVLQIPPTPIAEGLFDYQTYLRRQGIYYQLAIQSTNDWGATDNLFTTPFSDRFQIWAQNALQRGLPYEDEPLRLIWAMTLGWKTALTDEVSEAFIRSGTMHIFAISGLHIALISGILVALLRVLQVPRGYCAFIVIPLIWFYTGATGWQSSAIRSTIMMTIIVGGWSLRRPTDLLNSLAASALIILLWEPQQLFRASFQLSFFVVFSMGLLLPVFQKYREQWLNPDPLLPPELRPVWRKRLDFPIHFATTAFATSLAAWLGSLPLIAYYFHIVTPVSLLANFVIVPLSGLALMASLGSLLVGSWLPFAGELFNHAGWFFMKLMADSSHWFADLPGGYFYVPAPSILACAIYYLLLFTILNGWLAERRKRLVSGFLIVIALVLGAWHWRIESKTVKITVLPLNGGDAIFVDAPGRANDLLIDCGNENSARLILEPFLRAQGVNKLKSVLLTHGDLRHVGGAENIRQNFAVQNFIISPISARSPAYRKLISDLQNQPDGLKTLASGDQLGAWTILHPQSSDAFAQADDNAMVLRREFYGQSILLLSDLGRPGQNGLIERETTLTTDFVVSGLPTQTEPMGNSLLFAAQPKIIIVTDAEFPAPERASRKLRERLDGQAAKVIYCRESGAVTFVFDEGGCTVRTARDGRIDF